MLTSLIKELGARHSLLNLSVYDLVEEFARYRKARLDSLLDSNNYYLDSSLDINPKNNLEDEKAITAKNLTREQKKRLKALLNAKYSLCKSRDSNRTLYSRRLTDAYILYFKELLSNNSRIFANAIGIGKTQAIVLAILIGYFCFFSNSLLKNIGRLTKEKVIKMQINTTNAISKALAAANKLIILEANTPTMHSKAIKHCSALLAAQFIIVCSFRKVDKHIFRAYNTISVTAQRIIIRKGGPYIEKRFNATNKRDSVTSDRIYKIEDIRNIIANIKYDVSEHESSYKDILEKESLNKLEASRRIIFNSEDAAKAANTLLLLKEVCAKILIELYKLIVQVLAEIYVSIVYFNLDSKLELKVLSKQDVKTTS
ncbi:hypothetical protein HBI39_232380 [Parastagonospora nodorum]|nr:hypothetical protein HBI39_232380 [Parastagonospora nodorum]